MEAESLQSLTTFFQQTGAWREVLIFLPMLVALEAILSADNAIALAAISRQLDDPSRQRQALNLGLVLALLFRLALIIAARWALLFWPLQLLAAGYLLWLCGHHLQMLQSGEKNINEEESPANINSLVLSEPARLQLNSSPNLIGIVVTMALTDLAFSLDSISAAVAVTDRVGLIMAGGFIGILALRLTAGLFIHWLEVYRNLETAGYLAVGLVGLRLLIRIGLPSLEVPEWTLLLIVAMLFLWGFSVRNLGISSTHPEQSGGAN